MMNDRGDEPGLFVFVLFESIFPQFWLRDQSEAGDHGGINGVVLLNDLDSTAT